MDMGDVMTDQWFGITWAAWSTWYIVLPIIVMIGALLVIRWVRQSQFIDNMASKRHRQQMLSHASLLQRGIKTGLYAIACVCIAIALMRPQWGEDEQSVTQEGRDLVIALDISRSMLAQDMTPNRLTYAKNKIKRVIQQLQAERVALIIFSGDAVVQCPLTRDYNAFHLFLDGITAETVTAGTTAIESALHKAAQAFQSSGASDRQRLVLLLTDGEDFGSEHERMRKLLQKEQLRLFVMSIGTQAGAPIPEYNNNGACSGYKRDKKGHIAITRCNTQLAQRLAQACDGVYVQAREDDSDVSRLEQWVNHFEKVASEEVHCNSYIERYYVYCIPALIAVCLEWLL